MIPPHTSKAVKYWANYALALVLFLFSLTVDLEEAGCKTGIFSHSLLSVFYTLLGCKLTACVQAFDF